MIDKNKLITELDKLDCISNINYYTNNCNSHDDIVNTIEEIYEAELSAKEMFEELGFYTTIYNDGEIIIWTNRDIDCKISFYEHDKEYGVFGCCYINLEIHNAITTQLKELGWI